MNLFFYKPELLPTKIASLLFSLYPCLSFKIGDFLYKSLDIKFTADQNQVVHQAGIQEEACQNLQAVAHQVLLVAHLKALPLGPLERAVLQTRMAGA